MATVNKPKPSQDRRTLTLTGSQWMALHDLITNVLTTSNDRYKAVFSRMRPDDKSQYAAMRDTIKVRVPTGTATEQIAIEGSIWAMSRLPWLINESAGCRAHGINSELVSNIYNQLQRKA
jgi:hypothetical protein